MSDLDLFQKKTLAYGEELDADHPGIECVLVVTIPPYLLSISSVRVY